MKKFFLCMLIAAGLSTVAAFAQSDDDLFGGSDDALFGADDDLFGDDGIEEVSDVSAKSDLSKGVIFENGSVKVGGNVSASVSTNTVLYKDGDDKNFGEHIYDSTITPALSANLIFDARPTETLRMYTKFGLAYPFVNKGTGAFDVEAYGTVSGKKTFDFTKMKLTQTKSTDITITDWFKLKELFTDFSVKDTAFFRFGIHTVTWGAGYFFSPISDIINSSSIDPEHPEEQVDGSLNLRTQIIIPDSQNCIWLYVVPSTNFKNQTAESYLRDTALAGKVDILIGGWEFGLGGFYKYQNAPKAMLTATGSLQKVSFFGEFVYTYGAASEWLLNKEWDDKSSIFEATAGFSYYWKDPKLTIAAQYLFEGNDVDAAYKYLMYGHNAAFMISKGSLFKNDNLSLSLFGMANFGRKELDLSEAKKNIPMLAIATGLSADDLNSQISALENAMKGTSLTTKLTLSYKPFNEMTITCGPSLVFADFESKPVVSFGLGATLGGGKF